MNLVEAEAALERLIAAKRKAAVGAVNAKADRLRSYLFDKEIAFAGDSHRYVSACAGRRAGKSTTVAVMLLQAALRAQARFSVL